MQFIEFTIYKLSIQTELQTSDILLLKSPMIYAQNSRVFSATVNANKKKKIEKQENPLDLWRNL